MMLNMQKNDLVLASTGNPLDLQWDLTTEYSIFIL